MGEGTVRLAVLSLAVLGVVSIIEIGVLQYGGASTTNPVLATVAGGAVTGIGALVTVVARTPPSKDE